VPIWKDAEIESYFADETPSECSPCEVRINAGDIVVSMRTDKAVWRGYEISTGHYQLTTQTGNRAVLHRSPDSDTLEGYWVADGWIGMCRIDLNDDETEH
jgi:hypothetical protein